MSKTVPDGFQCAHCGKLYQRENAFLKHKCSAMEKAEILRSNIGHIAYDYYRKWLSTKRRANVNIDTFGSSKYFNQFVKFAKWVKKSKMHDLEGYLRFMNMKDFPPHMWTTPDVYQQYLEFVDRKWGPEDHARHTIKFLEKFARRLIDELDMDDRPEFPIRFALEELSLVELAKFITNRTVSPWILLNSTVFKRKFVNASQDRKAAISRTMDMTYWKAKMANNPEDNDYIKDVVAGFNL